ncbi:hypothetical protein CEP50_18600 [Actinopolyspora mortivallis]|uniref:Uncharacterized protein n=1 Tax=Actinopolyspora mortivallis TaxID=33906 RepID=A0A2T0GRX3_ACTMO|nr:hypothetical protein CEP50_18600 [Actinopolyspora mortivallis]
MLDSSTFLNDPLLDTPPDSLRSTLLTAAGGPAPLPAEEKARLAGFSWYHPEWFRLYVVTPGDAGVIGVDLDIPVNTVFVSDLMDQLQYGVPALWSAHERQTPDTFCHSLLDLRS